MVGHTEGAEAANSANHPADTGGTGLPGWAKVVLVLGGIAAVVVVMFGLALWALIASVQPPSIDEERIQEQLEAEGPGLEAEARPVLEAARVGDRRCPGPTAGTASTAPQATRIGRLYCSRDVVAGAFGAGNVIEGVDPGSRRLCGKDDVFVVVEVDRAAWGGAPRLVYSPDCMPNSWFDGDPFVGAELRPVLGPWYAERPLGAPSGVSR